MNQEIDPECLQVNPEPEVTLYEKFYKIFVFMTLLQAMQWCSLFAEANAVKNGWSHLQEIYFDDKDIKRESRFEDKIEDLKTSV